ncbi:tyrosine-protein phosphatase [Gracilibacillus sp. D59]|uniref:tyrosine-protein phosphatase n=1 Tax=Gracilibacillus sp. D59 TaxID=3457434 RepID=UPI003FCD0CBA
MELTSQEMEGSINLRDFGGYPSLDGRKVKKGVLFRSGELSKLSESGKEGFRQLGIRQIVDFRSSIEREQNPDPEFDRIKNIALPLITEEEQLLDPRQRWELMKQQFDQNKPEQLLIGMNRKMAHETLYLQQLIEIACDTENSPLLIHCAAGKDRTGVGSAVILLALGVPKDIIIEDYLKTNLYLEQLQQLENTQPLTEEYKDSIKELMSAKQVYLESFLDEIERTYLTVDLFLEKGLGLNSEQLEHMRNFYLE